MYRNDNNTYPGSLTAGQALVGANGQTYMREIPSEPGKSDGSCTTDTYEYNPDAFNASYHINYCLGGAVQSAGPASCEAVPGNICNVASGGGGGTQYDTGWLSPATAVNSDFGSSNWTNPANVSVSDNTYASGIEVGGGEDGVEYGVYIVKGNAISTTNIVDGSFPLWANTGICTTDHEEYVTHGGATELWGEAPWTVADVNSPNFGVAVVGGSYPGGSYSVKLSNYLKATNFNFNIPIGSVINGIQVGIEERLNASGCPVALVYIDHIRIKVYYTN